MTKKQTLIGAIKALRAGNIKFVWELHGLPAGGWPETQQAIRQIEDQLPSPSARNYSVDEFIEAIYSVDKHGRYRIKEA